MVVGLTFLHGHRAVRRRPQWRMLVDEGVDQCCPVGTPLGVGLVRQNPLLDVLSMDFCPCQGFPHNRYPLGTRDTPAPCECNSAMLFSIWAIRCCTDARSAIQKSIRYLVCERPRLCSFSAPRRSMERAKGSWPSNDAHGGASREWPRPPPFAAYSGSSGPCPSWGSERTEFNAAHGLRTRKLR